MKGEIWDLNMKILDFRGEIWGHVTLGPRTPVPTSRDPAPPSAHRPLPT